ncbi:MAG: acetylornithine/succinylornithine family transaminase [Clostridia bacterium]|nr:acetylornithine/succinylornithine family transaminase [Clostridia bacterium]
MNNATIQQRDLAYVANTYKRFPIAVTRGKGARCWDADDREYIDMTSGIGVNALGFCDEAWAKAVFDQLLTLQHTSNLYYTLPCGEVAETLCNRTGMKKVFFSNSGAESNEGAIKCARKYGHMRKDPGCHNILTLSQSFHGRTVTTLAATGQDAFHHQFHPFTDGFAYAPPNDLPATLSMIDANTCGVLIELVQGEGGVLPLDTAYVKGLAAYCAANDVLLLIDEVQTGMGRTGSLFAFERYGIHPDIVTVAKGLGGGLPIGAVLFGEKCADVLAPGEHATTFGANPAICAGAKVVLDRLDKAFLSEVDQKGAYIRQRLAAMPAVESVGGLGLMIGATLSGVTAPEAVAHGISNGVLLLTAKDRLRLLPPLTISWEEIEEGLKRAEKALS